MGEPHDFGLSASETLSHVATGHPTPGFTRWWRTWWQEIAHRGAWFVDGREAAGFAAPDRAGAPGVNRVIEAVDGVRIGARLVLPFGNAADPPTIGDATADNDPTRDPVDADSETKGATGASLDPALVCILLHGYGMSPGEPVTDDVPKSLIEPDDHADAQPDRLALLKLRVRGYPGSQADVGDLVNDGSGYAGHAIHDEHHWPVTLAVRDVVSAVLAVRRRWPAASIGLWGESFGGGLAAIAAGVLALHPDHSAPLPDRIVLALPTLGDWAWRFKHPAPAGVGAEVARFLERHHAARAAAVRNLIQHDAAYHARRITCPVFAKLACRDEVVPAPAAAAVFNALGAGPGDKWRYVVSFGHHEPTQDGGDDHESGEAGAAFADARRHLLFNRAAIAFLDPARAVDTAMSAVGRQLDLA